jgi:DNA processing protein
MAAALAASGLVAVSGLARGIDACAHRGALEAGGRTVAVMGTGPDTIYPYRHLGLAMEIVRSGALVTQFARNSPPLRGNFPARNAVISGMCLGVVVVEAAQRSGAMLTAGAAGHQGRAVMAVPGSVFSATSAGCHDLLRDGARLVTCAAEVLAELGAEPLRTELKHPLPTRPAPPRFGDLRDRVMELVSGRALTLDQLCRRTRTPAESLAPAVARLRLEGWVVMHEGVYRPSGGIHRAEV